MASVKFQKGSEYFSLFMDFWQLCQKHWQPEDNDKYWDNVIRDVDYFCKKYDNDFFPRALALVLVDDLERRRKNRLCGI